MKKILDVFKKPLWLLCLGLGIVVLFSVLANTVNTSGYQVSVTKVKMETENGKLAALRYAPKSCSADKKCATIITTHGYLNSKEMQDEAAIELSKRGYIVYALDMYDHGESENETTNQFTFWITSQWDAVNWVYDHEESLLKAADGTGMIAVAGHSMGGFSSRMAAYYDAAAVTGGAPQKVVAVLAMGADYYWIENPYFNLATADDIISEVGNRTYGTLAARYDEFFFLDGYPSETVVEKNWGKTNYGKATYYETTVAGAAALEDVKSGVWNDTSYGGGGSVIYIPNELHPWNHFSIESTAYQIDFYEHAFKNQIAIHAVTENEGVVKYGEGGGQSWWLKETFECIALAGMFIAIIAAIGTFAALPFFRVANTAEEEINPVATPSKKKKVITTIFAGVVTFALAYLYPMINLGQTATWYVDVLRWIMRVGALAVVALFIAKVTLKAAGREDEKASHVITDAIWGSLAIVLASLFAYWTLSKNFFANGTFYNEPGTNTIVAWAWACSGVTLVALVLTHVFNNKKDGYTLANYGLRASWKQVGVALLTAIITVCGVYLLTLLADVALKTDFRVWTYAIKTFSWNHFLAFLKYLPFYFAFYLVNAVSVVANTGTDRTWKGTLKAILLNICGVVFILGLHYGKLFITGTAHWPTQDLNTLLLFAVVPTLGLAAWIARKSYIKTGNIWTGVFISTFLFTLMQVANTTLYVMAK